MEKLILFDFDGVIVDSLELYEKSFNRCLAGVRTVAVTWGWHTRDRLTLSDPDLIIDSPAELLQL